MVHKHTHDSIKRDIISLHVHMRTYPYALYVVLTWRLYNTQTHNDSRVWRQTASWIPSLIVPVMVTVMVTVTVTGPGTKQAL